MPALHLGSEGYATDGVNGKVGIGTSSPSELLTITGATHPTIEIVPSATAQFSGLRIWNNQNKAYQGFFRLDDAGGELRIGNNVAWPVTFYTNNTEKMRITSTGKVGIGTTTPVATLEIADTATDVPEIRLLHDSGTGIGKISFFGSATQTEQANIRKEQGSGEFIIEQKHSGFPLRFKTPSTTSYFIFDGGGQIQVQDGSASAPVLSFSNDPTRVSTESRLTL